MMKNNIIFLFHLFSDNEALNAQNIKNGQHTFLLLEIITDKSEQMC